MVMRIASSYNHRDTSRGGDRPACNFRGSRSPACIFHKLRKQNKTLLCACACANCRGSRRKGGERAAWNETRLMRKNVRYRTKRFLDGIENERATNERRRQSLTPATTPDKRYEWRSANNKRSRASQRSRGRTIARLKAKAATGSGNGKDCCSMLRIRAML